MGVCASLCGKSSGKGQQKSQGYSHHYDPNSNPPPPPSTKSKPYQDRSVPQPGGRVLGSTAGQPIQIPTTKGGPRASNQNWMQNSMEHIGKLPLGKIMMPGSHCAGSFKINSKDKRSQNISIYQQLEFGVRYLDLTYGSNGSKDSEIYTFSGTEKGQLMTES